MTERQPPGAELGPIRLGLVAAVVGVLAAAFAHAFRDSMKWVMERLYGTHNPLEAFRDDAVVRLVAVAFLALALACVIARYALRWSKGNLGLSKLAASIDDPASAPTARWSAFQSIATWLVSVAGLSIGRESAIIETGGAVGSSLVRRRKDGPALIAAGVGSAFAAAYHAPISAVIYGEDHLGIRRSRRTLACGLLGAALGFVVARELFHGRGIFPGIPSISARMVVAACVGVFPAIGASWLFRFARERWTAPQKRTLRIASGAIAIALVLLFPGAAGNGMEAIRESAVAPTIALALSMCLVKIVATTAMLRTGVPGGVFSPTLAVAAGASTVTVMTVLHDWAADPVVVRGAAIAAMAAGAAVGLRSPLLGAVVVVEMTADLGALPLTVGAALIAWAAEQGLEGAGRRLWPPKPVVEDVDA